MDLPEILPFETKFEDLSIAVDSLKATKFNDDNEPELRFTALTDIQTFGMVKHYYEDGRGFAGGLCMIFRNQGEHFETIMMLYGTIRVLSKGDKDGASVFCKTIQCLFDWTSKYVTNNRIKDMNEAKDFIMPAFLYSKQDFPRFKD